MKKLFTLLLLVFYFSTTKILLADVTYTTEAMPNSTLVQSQNDAVIYIAKVDVSGIDNLVVNNVKFRISGSFLATDIASIDVMINTTPSATGATFLINNSSAGASSPIVFNQNISSTNLPAVSTRYIIIRASLSSSATNGNNFKINGGIPIDGVDLGFTGIIPTEINNQTDLAGLQTIQVPTVTYSTEAVPAANLVQSQDNFVIYIAKVDLSAGSNLTYNNIKFKVSGSFVAADIASMDVMVNTTATASGATFLINNTSVGASSPIVFNQNFGATTLPAGVSQYIIIRASLSSSATNNNNFKINGLIDGIDLGFTTSPLETNTQTDVAGLQTILVPTVTYSSEAVPAANLVQSQDNFVIYIAKVDLSAGSNLTYNNIKFKVSGSFVAADIASMDVMVNTTPTASGATFLINNTSVGASSPIVFNQNFGATTLPASVSQYIIIRASLSSSATNNNNFKINGLIDGVDLGFTTSPMETNNQTDVAGLQTILVPTVTYSSEAVPAANLVQSQDNFVIYIGKVDLSAGANLTYNNIKFKVSGSFVAADIASMDVMVNTTATASGATFLINNTSVGASSPIVFNQNFGATTLPAGSTRYIIVRASLSSSATNNNNFKINGLVDGIDLGFTTSPVETNNQTDVGGLQTILVPTVTYSSESVPAANLVQSQNDAVIYIAKVDLSAGSDITFNNIKFKVSGSFVAADIASMDVMLNTTPTASGATFLINNTSVGASSPIIFNQNFGATTLPAGSTRYIIIRASISASATKGNSFKINGGIPVDAVDLGFTTSPIETNIQTDAAGLQTIQAAGVSISSIAVSGAVVPQGANGNILYIAKMDVAGLAVTINSVTYTLEGNVDNNDLSSRFVYMNTEPNLTGATPIVNNQSVGFGAPHTFNTNTGTINIPAGETRYFMYVFNVSNTANGGNTFEMNGATNPVSFGFTTNPTVTNTQTDAAGTFAIQAANVTITSEPVTGGNANQSSTNNITYIAKVVVSDLPVTITSINYTLGGNVDNNDLSARYVYMNTTPTIGGTFAVNNQSVGFGAPHTFNTNTGNLIIQAGETRYFVFTFNVSATGTDGNEFEMDGAANPISFGFSTSPTVTNNQTDAAGTFTIGVPAVTLTTVATTPGGFTQGSTENILYIAKMDVATLPTTVNNINFTLTGTHDANDMSGFKVYANDTPDLVTPTNLLGGIGNASFAAPHTYNQQLNGAVVNAGETKYFIITINLNTEANSNASSQNSRKTVEIGNTIILDGAANPVVFGFSNGPTIINNQSNLAAIQSITAALPITLISFSGKNLGENQIELTWQTANEKNFDHFEIQRSVDAKAFEKIGTQLSNETGNYEFRDNSQLIIHNSSLVFYRLKMIDLDGSFSFSKIINVGLENRINNIVAYPNPTTDYLKIEIQSTDNEIVTLFLINNSGKIIESKTFLLSKGSNQLNWNTQAIAAGNYLISESNNKFEIKRFNKQ